jgi:hypothetical protein
LSAFEKLLSNYPSSVQELAKKARAFIHRTAPSLQEIVDPTSKIIAYGFRPKYADLVCAIAPQKNYVNLMFSKGTVLSDPHNLLIGTGKKARHIKVTDELLLDNTAVSDLIKQAVLLSNR